MRARMDHPDETATAVLKLIMDSLGQSNRVQQVLIASFLASPDWDAARDRFNRMQAAVRILSDDEFSQIQQGFKENDQLYNSIYLTNQYRRLARFLEAATGRPITISGRSIKVISPSDDIEIPF
jgi:predicted Zn-dependent peptidase